MIVPWTVTPRTIPTQDISNPDRFHLGLLPLEELPQDQFYAAAMIKIFSPCLPGFEPTQLQRQMKGELIYYVLICHEFRFTFREIRFWLPTWIIETKPRCASLRWERRCFWANNPVKIFLTVAIYQIPLHFKHIPELCFSMCFGLFFQCKYCSKNLK